MGRFLDAAEIVLKRRGEPLNARKLTDLAIELDLLKFSNGKTPYQTMKAKICVDIREKADSSRFIRAERGLYALREFLITPYEAKRYQKIIKPSEDVLVFPVKLLKKVGYFHGIRSDYGEYARILLDPSHTLFLPRVRAEIDINYKQILSYIIVKYKDSVLRFVRGSYTNVQAFLRGRRCIGFGGHVKSGDRNLLSYKDSGYFNSVHRELNEELLLPRNAVNADTLTTIGALNDYSSSLGQMHFAFVHLLDLTNVKDIPNSRGILKNEKSINQLKFIPIDKLGLEFEQYEYWSKLCIKAWFGSDIRMRAVIHTINNFELNRFHDHHIAIVGSIGSGKTEASQLLERSFGYSYLSVGDMLRKYLGIESRKWEDRNKFQDVALSFIESQGGEQNLAEIIYNRISGDPNRMYVIDGLRHPKTLEALKEKLKGYLILFYVDTSVDDAYLFFKQRERSSVKFEDFVKLYQHPVEQEIQQFISIANLVIYNNADKKSYLDTLRKYFTKELC